MPRKTGAPAPGGLRAPAPGGLKAHPEGGIVQDGSHAQAILRNKDFDIDMPSLAGPRQMVERSVANMRLGSAASVTSYNWTLPTKPGGSVATVTNATSAKARFTPDVAGTYVFRCTVTFSDGATLTREITYISA